MIETLLIIIGWILTSCLTVFLTNQVWKTRWLKKEKEIRKDAVERSKSIIRGQLNEELVPLFPDFPHDISKCKFLGKPVDYIVFGDDCVIIADVKTNTSSRTKVQNHIKDLIDNKKVKFETWVIENQKIKVK